MVSRSVDMACTGYEWAWWSRRLVVCAARLGGCCCVHGQRSGSTSSNLLAAAPSRSIAGPTSAHMHYEPRVAVQAWCFGSCHLMAETSAVSSCGLVWQAPATKQHPATLQHTHCTHHTYANLAHPQMYAPRQEIPSSHAQSRCHDLLVNSAPGFLPGFPALASTSCLYQIIP